MNSGGVKVPNTSVTIRRVVPKTLKMNSCLETLNVNTSCVHASIKHLYKQYPQIKIPEPILKFNLFPYVALPMGSVEEYFNKRRVTKVQKEAVSPIKIKISNSHKEKSRVIKKIKKLEKNDETTSIRKRKTVASDLVKSDIYQKKRKLSDSDSSTSNGTCSADNSGNEMNSNTEQNIIQSANGSDALIQVPSTQRTLQICIICNAVYYNLKDLKKHKRIHLMCPFCKAKFSTMQMKDEHMDQKCMVKQIMNSRPYVKIVKLECDKYIKEKYANLLKDYFPKRTRLNETETLRVSSKDNCTEKERVGVCSKENELVNIGEDIEDSEKTSVEDQKPLEELLIVSEEKLPKKNFVIEILSDDEDCSVTGPLSNVIMLNDPQTPNRSTYVISSSIIKPDIKIKHDTILQTLDPKINNIVILKNLLKNNSKVFKDQFVQSDNLINVPIQVNSDEFSFTLVGLKRHLDVYKIPVQINYGRYKISYVPTKMKRKKEKKEMALWNHMVPLGVAIPSAFKSNQGLSVNGVNKSIAKNTTATDRLILPKKSKETIQNTESILLKSISDSNSASNSSHTNSAVVIHQNTPISGPTQLSYQRDQSPTMVLNPSSNPIPSSTQLLHQANPASTIILNPSNTYLPCSNINSGYIFKSFPVASSSTSLNNSPAVATTTPQSYVLTSQTPSVQQSYVLTSQTSSSQQPYILTSNATSAPSKTFINPSASLTGAHPTNSYAVSTTTVSQNNVLSDFSKVSTDKPEEILKTSNTPIKSLAHSIKTQLNKNYLISTQLRNNLINLHNNVSGTAANSSSTKPVEPNKTGALTSTPFRRILPNVQSGSNTFYQYSNKSIDSLTHTLPNKTLLAKPITTTPPALTCLSNPSNNSTQSPIMRSLLSTHSSKENTSFGTPSNQNSTPTASAASKPFNTENCTTYVRVKDLIDLT